EFAVAALVDPSADGIAIEAGLDVTRPCAPVGENTSTGFADVVDPNEGRVRQDDDFHRLIGGHRRGHPRRQARRSRPGAWHAGLKFAQVGLEDGLMLRRERGLLSATLGFAGIERRRAGGPGYGGARPLAL